MSAQGGGRSKAFDRSIVEGPIRGAVWKLAWPTMLQNIIGGLQGLVDHAMVGNYVGYVGNAAIGVSWQIFLVVIVFISSLFTGNGRAGGALHGRERARHGESHRVPGVPDGRDDGRVRSGAHWVGAFAGAARAGQRDCRGAGRGTAVPPDNVRLLLRHAPLLHVLGSAAVRGRRADADATRDRDDAVEHWPQS